MEIVQRIGPDRIDTGMFIIGAKDVENIWAGVKNCLLLEKSLYSKMNTIHGCREGLIEKLIKKIEYRLTQMPDHITSKKQA